MKLLERGIVLIWKDAPAEARAAITRATGDRPEKGGAL